VAVHAEDNAISQAGREAIGATLYLAGLEDGKPIKAEPCMMCERKIKNARIAKVITEI
jgi:deoxycytidylate deaminase